MIGNTDLFDLYASLRRLVSLRANGVFKELGLGSRQFIILWSLIQNKRMSVGQLVEASMTDAATVSRSLVQLMKHGYLEKIQCENDGRVWYVQLTAKGLALAPQMEQKYDQLAHQCFAVLKTQEREQLATLLGKVVGEIGNKSTLERQVEV